MRGQAEPQRPVFSSRFAHQGAPWVLGRRSRGAVSEKQVVGDRYEIVPLSGGYAGRKVFDKPCRMWAQVTGSWSGVFRTGGSRKKRAIMK